MTCNAKGGVMARRSVLRSSFVASVVLLSLVVGVASVYGQTSRPVLTVYYYLAPTAEGAAEAQVIVPEWQFVPKSAYFLLWQGEPQRLVAGATYDPMMRAWWYCCMDGDEVGASGIWTGDPDTLRAVVETWWHARAGR